MKRSGMFLAAFAVIASIGLFGCKGNDGPTGPTGNANVLMFSYPAFTDDGNIPNQFRIPLSKAKVDSCGMLIYVFPSGVSNSYTIPGWVGSLYYYRTIISTYTTDTTILNMVRVEGTGTVDYAGARIIVIPANVFAKPVVIDWENYAEVARYLNLPE